MAKKSKIARQEQRTKMVAKYWQRRQELRKRSVDIKLGLEERMQARAQLALLPRNSSHTRLHNRCAITGRARAYIRRVGICRHMLRELAHQGVLPGIHKASW